MQGSQKLALVAGLGALMALAATPLVWAQDAQGDEAAEQAAQALDDFSDIAGQREDNAQSEDQAAPDAAPPGNSELDEETQAALDVIAAVVDQIDPDAKRNGNSWELTLEERKILVVTDVSAGRMRVMTPIAAADQLPDEGLMRLLQANFDTALDARYAVAQNLVWGTFIHPLKSLNARDFASGVLQTKALADTFGTTFSSGILSYGAGDSGAIIGEQLEELLKELEDRDSI